MSRANQCPICKASNQCAIAADNNAKNCWCQQQTFSDDIIKKAQKANSTQHCICQNCAEKALKLATAAQ